MSGGVLRQVASHEFFLGAEPGAGPRAARREKRLVRFVHPSGMTSHELILLRQKELDSMSIRPARSTADEFGLRPPKLHTPREKAGTLRDPTYLERRRRVLDLNHGRQIFDLSPYPHVESILSTRPSGVPTFGEADDEEENTNATRYPQVCAAALVCPATPCCLRPSAIWRRKGCSPLSRCSSLLHPPPALASSLSQVRAAKVPFETVADNGRESHQVRQLRVAFWRR